MDVCAADSKFTTMCAGRFGCADLRDWAMREGWRRENATRGCGSMAMDVNDDSVAP